MLKLFSLLHNDFWLKKEFKKKKNGWNKRWYILQNVVEKHKENW
jgi:hypothetical protein